MMRCRLRIACLVLTLAAPSAAQAGAYDDLLNAMNQNDVPQVMRLLQRGMDVNTSDRMGNTLLMMAARAGEDRILDYLLENRANVLRQNKYGDTALMLAALNGQISAVTKLVSARSEINPKGWTPLIYAAFNGHVEVMRVLLTHGADVDAQAENGTTALMAACRNGHQAAVKLLLDEEADLDLVNQGQLTALKIGLAARNIEIARLLKAAGASE